MTVYLIHPNGDFQTLHDALAAVVPGDGIAIYMPVAVSSATINTNNITLYADSAYVHELEVVLGAGVTQFQTEGDTLFTVVGNELDNVINAKAGNEVMIGGPGDDILGFTQFNSSVDFGGIEYASYEYDPAGVTVTFFNNVGFATDGYGDSDTLWGVEGVIGSQFDDVFHGNDFDNIFIGLGGKDNFWGGLGTDTVSYEKSQTTGVTISLQNTGITEDSFGDRDVFFGIENLIGSDFADSLTGTAFDNEFFGGAGDDFIDGSLGQDTVSYDNGRSGQSAVNVNLLTGIAVDGLGGTDTLVNIERVIGTEFADILTGGDGDDTFVGGAGNDIINGGDGFDTVSYPGVHSLSPRIVVNLALGTAADGHGGEEALANHNGIIDSDFIDQLVGSVDTLTSIEAVIGSNFVDRLTGDANYNEFTGRGGDDIIDGGDGIDIARYNDNQGRYAGAYVNLANQTALDGWGGTDTLINIEGVFGSSLGDVLIGDDGDNIFVGGEGADTINGGAGFDTIDYSGNPIRLPLGGFTPVGLPGVVEPDPIPQLTVDIMRGKISDGLGFEDSITGIERVVGSGNDDTFYDGVGSHSYDGGEGYDLLSYAHSSSGIHLERLITTFPVPSTRQVTSADGSVDQIANFESFVGTSSNDDFSISAGHGSVLDVSQLGKPYSFDGGDGHDVLNVTLHHSLIADLFLSIDVENGTIAVSGFTVARFSNFEVVNGRRVSGQETSSDFDGDGDDDVVFSLTASGNSVFNNADGSGGGWIGYADRTVIGTGDFNGDGDADLLFRFADGNHSGFDSGGGGPWLGRSDRTAVAVGDFNGDGDDDVLFEFANGNKHIADADSGNTWVGFADRSVQGVGDFDGDGDDDVLFELDAGGYVTNNVDGTGGRWLGGPARDVAGIGDFDGDGDDDILFVLNSGGHIINDGEGGGMQWFGFTDRSVAGIGDFDGDGNDDILFRLADGNHTIISPNGVGRWIARTNNTVRDVGDYDGDGDDDILFEAPGGGFVVDQADGGVGLGMYFLDRMLVGGDPLGIGLTSDADLV